MSEYRRYRDKPVDIEKLDKVVRILGEYYHTHTIRMTTDCDSDDTNTQYDESMQRRPKYTHSYTCNIICDKCGWKFSGISDAPENIERYTHSLMNLVTVFILKVPVDCHEAEALKAAADIHES